MKKYTAKNYRRLGLRRTDSPKDPTARRNYPPGIHGPKGHKRLTQYGSQMAEKQKAKVIYNILERQLKKYYNKAIKQKGDTGIILGQLIEMRLDNVIYRSGLAKTRPQARQLVSHGFFFVNNKKVNIPSYQVAVKDEITIRPNKLKTKIIEEIKKNLEKHVCPTWIYLEPKMLTVKILEKPKAEEMDQRFSTRLIVEFYSR
ncbi:MAG: 30S ribosomal protein S4 [Candidatus Buchananbacteria bacterium RIFCSPHIGHO2_01_FULL_44_11]|uniref:Small ribosomal subunit protein uS4 n=1 Tax=Candidatus Buchananbacteria bacterium RIFCSPHIGHO2_01_FULL_44_11 TaxID=1797535 RepID=A0A1G1Y3R7_9BACT|nr:MAG: 30S ribosomal protein S4 [Candidatus Buchananbacteria bacterium RIFCSPHIGHO2_01_FULL_44_11]